MSYLAIGAVTRTLAELLEKKMNKPALLGGITPKVTTMPPDDERVDDADGVNLFLYKIAESPFARNMDWRGDRSNPVGSKYPPLAVTLHYLLTAYARPANGTGREDITAHQLIGNAMAILHEYPVVNDVHDADFDADLDTQFPRELRDSFEKVKITMMPFSMEEFSKIWTGLNKGYRLSVGYEVSLVQIAPMAPAKSPGSPPPQQIGLQAGGFSMPVIASLTPSTGQAGQEVTIEGINLKKRGSPTSVVIEDLELGETDLTSITAEKIVFNIPEALQRGPKLHVSVVVGSLESAQLVYEVRPWITAVQPLRGLTGIPLTLPFDIPPGATISVEIDAITAVATIDAANKIVRAIVPAGITTNGPKPVVLIVDTGTPQRSNARFYEVLPMVTSANVTPTAVPAKTTIQVNGQRLSGKDVYVRYGKLLIAKGENLNAAQVTVEVARVLPTNLPVSVLVDNRESNALPPVLESLDPPQAFAGDNITLNGSGLSGQNVVVSFGATNVAVGAHAYATQLSVRVPPALAPGATTVRVTVNGNQTNALPFSVVV
ncbi:MAG: Pvc16 family protein [Pyrinomonadaceae bacterium]